MRMTREFSVGLGEEGGGSLVYLLDWGDALELDVDGRASAQEADCKEGGSHRL